MKIKLNNKFYDKKVVEDSLKDFKGVCEGNILNKEIEIELKPRGDVKNLQEEFCNYVLGMMKNKINV